MTLPVVPTDSANEKQHRTVIATSLNELIKFYNTIKTDTWTAVIRGNTTAGTYEIGTQNCRYTRIGRRVFLDVYIRLAAAITGGGVGYLQITGAPHTKIATTFPQGSVLLESINTSVTGSSLSLSFDSVNATSVLYLAETSDNAASGRVPISGVSANDEIYGSICYETDDP